MSLLGNQTSLDTSRYFFALQGSGSGVQNSLIKSDDESLNFGEIPNDESVVKLVTFDKSKLPDGDLFITVNCIGDFNFAINLPYAQGLSSFGLGELNNVTIIRDIAVLKTPIANITDGNGGWANNMSLNVSGTFNKASPNDLSIYFQNFSGSVISGGSLTLKNLVIIPLTNPTSLNGQTVFT